MNNCTLEFSTNTTTIFFLEDQLYSHLALFYFWHSLAGVFLQVNRKYVLLWFYQVYFFLHYLIFFFKIFWILISINNGSLEGRGTGIDHYLAGILFDKENNIKICSPHLFNIMFCTSQIPSLAYGTTSGRVLMSEYKCGICTNKQLLWEKEFTLMKKYLEHLCKVGNINVLVLDAGSNFRYFDFFVECPTDLQAVHEMALYL